MVIYVIREAGPTATHINLNLAGSPDSAWLTLARHQPLVTFLWVLMLQRVRARA